MANQDDQAPRQNGVRSGPFAGAGAAVGLPSVSSGMAGSGGSTGAALPADIHTDAGGDYNALPYPTMPITLSQPLHMAALAALFGVDAPPVERARVLELGCASGGNIIPLAVRFPQARFSGIDLSQRHVEQGRKAVADLGLKNVTLQQADLATFDLGGQQYDYIICHGVFSWVPKVAQDAIFRLCRQGLVPTGVATMSYNVMPGWHLRMVIRDLCLRYAGSDGSPQRRVAKARAALAQLAEASTDTDPYGQLLRTEAKRLKNVPAAYILGEFLAPDNAPCYVQDFIEQAANAGLDYLCEADLFATVPPALDPVLRGKLTSTGGPARPSIEQDIDFLTGRLFRRSILVPRQDGAARHPAADPQRLQGLHVSSQLRFDPAQSTDEAAVFVDDQNRPVTTREAVVREAFQRLATAYPATLSMATLTASVQADEPADEQARADAGMRIRTASTHWSWRGGRRCRPCRWWSEPRLRSGPSPGRSPGWRRSPASHGSLRCAMRACRRIRF